MLHRFHFPRDRSHKINKSVFSFPSPYNSSSSPLIYSLSCHHAFAGIAKSCFCGALGYYTQLHLTFEPGFLIFYSCPFHKAQNHLCSIKAIVTSLLCILYILLLQILVCLFFLTRSLLFPLWVFAQF